MKANSNLHKFRSKPSKIEKAIFKKIPVYACNGTLNRFKLEKLKELNQILYLSLE